MDKQNLQDDVIRIILKDLDVCDIHSTPKKRRMTAIKIYKMFLEQGSSTSAQGETQKVLPFFDYPLFIKELNYTKLLKLFECEEQFQIEKEHMDYGQHHQYVHIPFMNNNIVKSLAKIARDWYSHLDINLYNNSEEFAKESINYLEEFISAQ
ncbi:hypothetical protein Glove_168g268 [Diversispora epigaea]|uniref:Uncharacterized protein n=1 Tax=Diversispora epigaea TaxID=1348612 RepID=A0A397IZK6_9GLOM|nr:hypothetical protein Glove_168g268 [Diversispora epigaea]